MLIPSVSAHIADKFEYVHCDITLTLMYFMVSCQIPKEETLLNWQSRKKGFNKSAGTFNEYQLRNFGINTR